MESQSMKIDHGKFSVFINVSINLAIIQYNLYVTNIYIFWVRNGDVLYHLHGLSNKQKLFFVSYTLKMFVVEDGGPRVADDWNLWRHLDVLWRRDRFIISMYCHQSEHFERVTPYTSLITIDWILFESLWGKWDTYDSYWSR